MISIFDKYVLKTLSIATFVTALSLTLIILLTQSIRYLELVISSDASTLYFLVMLGLAIPNFLEIIMPLAFSIGAIYTANKLMNDREIIVMTAAGASPLIISRAFILFAGLMMCLQFVLSGWISPIAVAQLQKTRADVKSNYATLMFREGVFNKIGNDLTVYVEKRVGMNELKNLVIHDEKGIINKGHMTTIIAKRGIVNLDRNNQQLLVYDGTQYEQKKDTNRISRLDFKQYTLEIPAKESTITTRWQEPDERTFNQLFLSKATASARDISKKLEFIAEINKRLSTPLLYAAFILIIIVFQFMGEWNRRNQTIPLVKVGISIVIIQALYIIIYNEARDAVLLNLGLYIIAILPIGLAFGKILHYQRGFR